VRLFTYRAPVLPWSLVLPLEVLRVLLWLAAVLLLRAVLFAKRHPDTATILATAGFVAWWSAAYGAAMPGAVVFAVAALGWLWFLGDPASFDRYVTTPLRSRWRRQLVYRREWQPAMVVNNLDRDGALPRLRRVVSTGPLDVVRVTILPGQTLDDWRAAAPRLAAAFGVRVVRPRKVAGRPYELELHVRRATRAVVSGFDTDDEAPPEPRGAFPKAPR
jgi:DNA segregation ATPase FtsK/SpoIIIE, S-DNA-T family